MNRDTKERKELIRQLQEQAKEVLELKEHHRQKRPIVIEFSGSPKAGKTSCINSLEIFLKRNGFRVEIIHERASVCPVSNKLSPMFNIWTACMSITGMLGALEKRCATCDVLILDRGIFDAFCWFNWLKSKNIIDEEQKREIEAFLSMDCFTKVIDIIFSFQVTPEKSIEREYASLLTDKPGSIMNECVLKEYLEAINQTIANKKAYFHNIIEIDTTDQNQDMVGQIVTTKTLSTLGDLLMEKIAYFKPSDKERDFIRSKNIFSFEDLSSKIKLEFDLRNNVENNDLLIQPIPIAVITNKERSKVLVIKKTKKSTSEKSPEREKLLLYVGGHSRVEDYTEKTKNDLLAICKYTLRREIKEEIGIEVALDNISPRWIYTPNQNNSKKHIALCFLIETDVETLKLRLDSEELIQTKGTTKSGRFHKVGDLINNDAENFEEWSELILETFFGKTIPKNLTLFDCVEEIKQGVIQI